MKEKVEVEAAAAIKAGDAGTIALPRSLTEMIGQKDLLRRLTGLVELARRRKEVLGHVLLLGPDGCGKSTTAHTIARELGVNVRATEASRIERPAISPRLSLTSARAIRFLSKILAGCEKIWSMCCCRG